MMQNQIKIYVINQFNFQKWPTCFANSLPSGESVTYINNTEFVIG